MKIRRNTRLDRILCCPENRIQRDAQIWHTVFSMLTAVQSTLLLFILARVCGSGDAGIFSLAISVGYLMIMIGNYGVRNYQVTDIVPVYGFREYRTHRWTTCLIMTAVSLGYVLLRGYETEKALSVFLVCVLKVIESVENVYHAEYQRVNRLDTASKIGTIRISTTTLAFVAAILITRSLWISILVMDLAAAGFLVWLLCYTYPRIPVTKSEKSPDWKKLFVTCFPLFISSFCYIYICNASKYALDYYASESVQGYFGMIFMPVSVSFLISNCFYGPFLVRLAGYWGKNETKPIRRFIGIETAGVLLICAVISAAGYLWGTQVLSFIYGCDLQAYRMPLTILLLGSGMTALVDFSINLLTVIRKQNIAIWFNCGFALLAFGSSRILVGRLGVEGAAWSYFGVMTVMVAVMMMFLLCMVNKGNVEKESGTV